MYIDSLRIMRIMNMLSSSSLDMAVISMSVVPVDRPYWEAALLGIDQKYELFCKFHETGWGTVIGEELLNKTWVGPPSPNIPSAEYTVLGNYYRRH